MIKVEGEDSSAFCWFLSAFMTLNISEDRGGDITAKCTCNTSLMKYLESGTITTGQAIMGFPIA